MNGHDLTALGYRSGPLVGHALRVARRLTRAKMSEADILTLLAQVIKDPLAHASDARLDDLPAALIQEANRPYFVERDSPAPYPVWGEGLEEGALMQMRNAARLPVAVRGALMPDAHQGYGLPIGGVLAVDNAVIPYAVGVDIACRMKLSVLDIPATDLERMREPLANVLRRETQFGAGATLKRKEDHDVLDADWNVTPLLRKLRTEKVPQQLGTSGSGNHFVEFGILTLPADEMSLEAGQYLALLSHSGSRGPGATRSGRPRARSRHGPEPRCGTSDQPASIPLTSACQVRVPHTPSAVMFGTSACTACWKARTALCVSGPYCPSTASSVAGLPDRLRKLISTCTPLTAEPRLPDRHVMITCDQVIGPTMPSTARPAPCWKCRTAASVSAPNGPSAVKVAPCALSRRCSVGTG